MLNFLPPRKSILYRFPNSKYAGNFETKQELGNRFKQIIQGLEKKCERK